MSARHNRWLTEQLPDWERDGIITAEGAGRLRERYAVEATGGLVQLIIGAIGGLLIGTGLVAVLAYNWDDFPRWVRLLLAFGPLAGTQVATWFVLQRAEEAKPWQREAASLLQTFAAGAALALVSQIYHLPGHWTELVFWWCIVSLPLAWVLKSQTVAIAYLIGITVWTLAEASEQGPWGAADAADIRIWFPLLLSGIAPLWPGPTLREQPGASSRFVLAATTLLGLFAVAASAGVLSGGERQSVFWLCMLSCVSVLLFPLTQQGVSEPLQRKPQVVLGGLVLVGLALVASYEGPARSLVAGVRAALVLPWCWFLLAVVICFGVFAFRRQRYAVLAVAGLALVPLLAAGVLARDASGWPVAIAYSLVLLATAIGLIALEFLGRQGAARVGAALITILVILRMADADFSLLSKGLAFICIGAGFLGFNLFISRRRAAVSGDTAI